MYEDPAIHKACVIAVDDPHHGEIIKALVVPRLDQRGNIPEQDIIYWCRRMSVYKAQRLVEFMDNLR